MTAKPAINDAMRLAIIERPELILEDPDVMRALVGGNERHMGTNIVDMRGIAMERLEARLDRLEDAHRTVISAAFDNLSSVNVIHRAALRVLETADFETLLETLGGEAAEILRVDCVRLVLETPHGHETPNSGKPEDVLVRTIPGFVDEYFGDRIAPRPAVVRQCQEQDIRVYGDAALWIRSEACLRLDLGENCLPGMLVLGSEDPQQFKTGQAVDFLTFFAGVVERATRRWME